MNSSEFGGGLSPFLYEWICSGSGAVAPEPAVAPRDEGQARRIARPALVLGQLEFLFSGIPAFAVLRELLHFGGRVLQERELVPRILLGAETVAWTGVAGNQALPIHRDHLLDEGLGFDRIEVEHAASRHRSHRNGVYHENDFLLRQA